MVGQTNPLRSCGVVVPHSDNIGFRLLEIGLACLFPHLPVRAAYRTTHVCLSRVRRNQKLQAFPCWHDSNCHYGRSANEKSVPPAERNNANATRVFHTRRLQERACLIRSCLLQGKRALDRKAVLRGLRLALISSCAIAVFALRSLGLGIPSSSLFLPSYIYEKHIPLRHHSSTKKHQFQQRPNPITSLTSERPPDTTKQYE